MKTLRAFYFRVVRPAVCRQGKDSHVEKIVALDIHVAFDRIRKRFSDAEIFAVDAPKQKHQKPQHVPAAR